jgi:hypothetical protein
MMIECARTLLFLFLNELMDTGSNKTLEMDDVHDLPAQEQAHALAARFVCGTKPLGGAWGLMKVLLMAYGMQRWIAMSLLMILWTALQIIQPFILRRLVLFFYDQQEHWSIGVAYTCALAADALISSLVLNHRFYHVILIICA